MIRFTTNSKLSGRIPLVQNPLIGKEKMRKIDGESCGERSTFSLVVILLVFDCWKRELAKTKRELNRLNHKYVL